MIRARRARSVSDWSKCDQPHITPVADAPGSPAYEHWLVRPDDLTRVNQAFFQVNSVVSVGLLLVVWLQLAVGW